MMATWVMLITTVRRLIGVAKLGDRNDITIASAMITSQIIEVRMKREAMLSRLSGLEVAGGDTVFINFVTRE